MPDRFRKLARLDAPQTGECVDHTVGLAHAVGGAGIGTELAMAGEPGDNHGGQNAEYDLTHDRGDEVAD
jgi:hypothetical protein